MLTTDFSTDYKSAPAGFMGA